MTAMELNGQILLALRGQSAPLQKVTYEDENGNTVTIDPNKKLEETAIKIAQAIVDYVENPEGGNVEIPTDVQSIVV